MSVVTVVPSLPHTCEIRGKAVLRVLARANAPKIYCYKPASGQGPCWTFPRRMLGDVEAAIETLRGVVLVVEHIQEALL